MRPTILRLLAAAALIAVVGPAQADDFTATSTGGWKSPGTWGHAGNATGQQMPGMQSGRPDNATIPDTVSVNFEGGSRSSSTWVNLNSLTVNGVLQAGGSRTPINVRTTGDLTVGNGARVGGSPGSKDRNQIELEVGGKATINGTVETEYGNVKLEAGGEIKVGGSGKINSKQRSVSVVSTGGAVDIAAGGSITGRRNVLVQAGPGQPMTVGGTIKSEKGSVFINGRLRQNQAGNVTVPPGGSIEAPNGEVVITADTLRVGGTIKGRTIKKKCNVVIIEPGGSIEGKGSEKNKVAEKKKAEQPRDDPAEPAEKGGETEVIGDDHCVIDYSFANGTVLQADAYLRVATGAMGTLDLTGIPPGMPVFECPGPIEIFADDILLDPGVALTDLAGPGPVAWGPAVPVFSNATAPLRDAVAVPGRPGEVEFVVSNMGNVLDDLEVTVTDSLGWGLPWPGGVFPMSPHPDRNDTIVTIPFDPPPWATPDVDTNSLVVRVRSLGDPLREYVENVYVPVIDESELRDVNLAVWDIVPAPAGTPTTVQSWLMNTGQLPDDFEITVSDAAGWPVLPPPSPVFLDAGGDSILTVGIDVPPGVPQGTPSELHVTATSLAAPIVAFTDTVPYFVNAVSGVEAPLPRVRSIEHWSAPNPFNAKVRIFFAVPDGTAPVTVDVYDLGGRHVAQLFRGVLPTWHGRTNWDGTDDNGRSVASGVYVYRIAQGGHAATGKVMLAK